MSSGVRKVLLREGVWHAPRGVLRADGPRLKRWAETFAAMKAAGIRVPLAWGHQPDAWPELKDKAERQEWLARRNAGYVAELGHNPETGELVFTPEAPGLELDGRGNLCCWTRLPDGREVRTAVGEVSAAVGDWRDGSGKVWKDAIVHVALTPLPVMHGQRGFEGVSNAAPAAPKQSSGPLCLSLAAWLGPDGGEGAMADEMEMEEGGGVGVEDAGQGLGDLLGQLEAHGIALPADTTSANLVERLKVALTALGSGAGDEAPEEEPDGDEMMPEPEAGGEAAEAPRPTLMSLSGRRKLTALERKFLEREQARAKAAKLASIERMVKAQFMPPAKADAFRAALTGYELSLTPDGEVAEGKLDWQLSAWEEAFSTSDNRRKLSVKGARPAARQTAVDDKEALKAAQEMARRVSRVQ